MNKKAESQLKAASSELRGFRLEAGKENHGNVTIYVRKKSGGEIVGQYEVPTNSKKDAFAFGAENVLIKTRPETRYGCKPVGRGIGCGSGV